jgi:hypothetical protein
MQASSGAGLQLVANILKLNLPFLHSCETNETTVRETASSSADNRYQE